ncbi:hypothetical protein J4214_05370 [Candidatus Woesearchaeota archaeon]|nr:hypothetical protein [Candidatus Woesearchaeota archaeon]
MSLVDIISNVSITGKKIVIVETPPDNFQQYEEQKAKINDELKKVSGRNTSITAISSDQIDSYDLRDSVVLINGNNVSENGSGRPVLLSYIIQAVAIRNRIIDKVLDINPRILFNNGKNSTVNGAIASVLKAIIGNEQVQGLTESFEDLGFKGNVVEGLYSQLESLKHGIGTRKNATFLDDLSQRFTEGNLQSTENKTFLIITDKAGNYKGKFDILKQDSDLNGLNFEKYHLVVIDNNDELSSNSAKLGRGINTLERLAEEFINRGIEVPVIYQSAHTIDNFSENERARITSFPNTNFMPKNCAPKIVRSKKVARKEISVGELVQSYEHLARYTLYVEKVGDQGFIRSSDKERFITFSRAVPIEIDNDEFRNNILQKAGVEYDKINHKMYVLSLFHTYLKNELKNENLKRCGKDYFDFTEVQSDITSVMPEISGRLESLRNVYDEAVREQKVLEPRVIAHNDAKWDNWFNGMILGDYGSVAPGREYNDVARALLDTDHEFKDVFDINKVNSAVTNYLALRSTVDPAFNDNKDEFRRNVYRAFVTESLRIAKYKAKTDKNLTYGLIKVAEIYAEILSAE